MAEREITHRGDYPWPSAVRQDTAFPIYADPKEKLPPHIKFDLSEGAQPFGMPPFIAEVKQAMFEGNKFERAIGTYQGDIDLEEAEEFNYKWFGIRREDVHISFGNRGSYGSIMDFHQNVLKAPSQGKVRLMSVNGLDFPALKKVSLRYETESTSPYHPNMPFYALPHELLETQDQILEKAIEDVRDKGKRGMKGFVVMATIPSSPKGSIPEDKQKMEELAELSAKYGYVLGIDEVFMPMLTPANSYAYLLPEYHKNMVLYSSPSKLMGLPGLRHGTMLLSTELGPKYEGTRPEYEFAGLNALFASEYYKFKFEQPMKDWLKYVVDNTVRIKPPLVKGVRSRGIEVYDTDMRVPIFLVGGKHENFCRKLDELGVRVAPGNKGFTDTYSTPMPGNYNKAVMTGQFARVTIPPTLEDIDEILDIFEEANKYDY